jgi:hypothetical protein
MVLPSLRVRNLGLEKLPEKLESGNPELAKSP